VGDSDQEGCKVSRVFKENPKLELLLEVLREVEGKAIIWCAWRHNVYEILARLRKEGISAVDYTGATEDRRKNEMLFRNDPSVKCFVGTGAAGSLGLNLQGPTVATVIYFSNDWKVLTRQQSEDRCHRGTIKHNVTIIDLVAKGTVEESIVKALRKGRSLQESLLTAPKAFAEGTL
jgi:SNF2 family DNA or RNA helicase